MCLGGGGWQGGGENHLSHIEAWMKVVGERV